MYARDYLKLHLYKITVNLKATHIFDRRLVNRDSKRLRYKSILELENSTNG